MICLSPAQAVSDKGSGNIKRTLLQLPTTHDWKVSTNLAERVFENTKWWLLSCSRGEGGSGPFVWHNSYGPGIPLTETNKQFYTDRNIPGGWMQFKPSTFNAYLSGALLAIKNSGYKVNGNLVSYYEPLGQALVAGYMRSSGVDRGQWTGYGC